MQITTEDVWQNNDAASYVDDPGCRSWDMVELRVNAPYYLIRAAGNDGFYHNYMSGSVQRAVDLAAENNGSITLQMPANPNHFTTVPLVTICEGITVDNLACTVAKTVDGEIINLSVPGEIRELGEVLWSDSRSR